MGGDCSNFECHNQTWGDKIRCSKCRHAKNYTCASCGDNVNTNRAIRCKLCADTSHSWAMDRKNERTRNDPIAYKNQLARRRELYHKRKVVA